MAETASPDDAALQLYREVVADMSAAGRTKRVPEIEGTLDTPLSSSVRGSMLNLLTHVHFQSGAFAQALAVCTQWLELDPGNIGAKDSYLSILVRLKRYDEIVVLGEQRLEDETDNIRLLSSLANAHGKLGAIERACELGELTLAAKDKQASGAPNDLADKPVPPFDPRNREGNIIAFSLYGAHPRYCQGALRNVEASAHIYPEWTCRFYIDSSVPSDVVKELTRHGAQVKKPRSLPAGRFGTFWRFLVADDPSVERFLVRDCDACVNLRERAAVEDWIVSGRHFHVMRDAMTHTDLILAGMWGAVRGALPPIKREIADFALGAQLSRTADQTFLRERIWPTVKQSVLAHDSHFRFGDAVDFPARANIPGLEVGRAV